MNTKQSMRLCAFWITIGLCLLLSLPAIAHERRDGVTPSFNIIVGHRVEPAFRQEPNAFDFIVNNAVDDSPANDAVVELEVYVIRLETEAFDGKIFKKRKLTGKLRRDFSMSNRYNISYMPKWAGTYGFIIEGTIDGEPISEKFVCGQGTLNPEGDAFGCIELIQQI